MTLPQKTTNPFYKTSHKKRRGFVARLKIMCLVTYHKAKKDIICLRCGKRPDSFVSIAMQKRDRVNKKNFIVRIPAPEGFTFHLKNKDVAKLDFFRDCGFLCPACSQEHHRASKELENEALNKFKHEQSLGGDVYELNPYRGGIWGNGK